MYSQAYVRARRTAWRGLVRAVRDRGHCNDTAKTSGPARSRAVTIPKYWLPRRYGLGRTYSLERRRHNVQSGLRKG